MANLKSEDAKRDEDEIQLAKVTKSLLAMPHKLREDFKIAKPKKPKRKPAKRAG